MNYLAHIYLSGDNPEVTIGNFIADGIRGKKYTVYPKNIQIGILLHREIDTFTDAHKTVRKSTKRLHEKYSHYSGVIVDILYDHFLAKNWKTYSDIELSDYAQNFYSLLETNYSILPEYIQKMMPYMIADNWLVNYGNIEGIEKVLIGVNKRTKNISKMNLAINELQTYYTEFESEFTEFFDDLNAFSKTKLNYLTNEKVFTFS